MRRAGKRRGGGGGSLGKEKGRGKDRLGFLRPLFILGAACWEKKKGKIERGGKGERREEASLHPLWFRSLNWKKGKKKEGNC